MKLTLENSEISIFRASCVQGRGGGGGVICCQRVVVGRGKGEMGAIMYI
jgi:hypothetical protein